MGDRGVLRSRIAENIYRHLETHIVTLNSLPCYYNCNMSTREKTNKSSAIAATKPKKVPGRPFPKGTSGNPKGKKVGTRDRRTVIMDALKRIAEKKGMTPEEIEEAIQTAGIEKAIKGSFFHYQEISNGLYGKISDKVDITSKGKTLADVLTAASHARRKSTK